MIYLIYLSDVWQIVIYLIYLSNVWHVAFSITIKKTGTPGDKRAKRLRYDIVEVGRFETHRNFRCDERLN